MLGFDKFRLPICQGVHIAVKAYFERHYRADDSDDDQRPEKPFVLVERICAEFLDGAKYLSLTQIFLSCKELRQKDKTEYHRTNKSERGKKPEILKQSGRCKQETGKCTDCGDTSDYHRIADFF